MSNDNDNENRYNRAIEEPNAKLSAKWILQGLDEHSSIGTFAKFSIDLMSIGAPLWMIQLAHEAAIDEIRHAQISFDFANAYSDSTKCAMVGPFPKHEVHVDRDWNRISIDAALGGCIGETLAAFKMKRDVSAVLGYEGQMAMDEVKHAALAWASVKWMTAQREHLDVADDEWWMRKAEVMDGGRYATQRATINTIHQQMMDAQDVKTFYLYPLVPPGRSAFSKMTCLESDCKVRKNLDSIDLIDALVLL